jgi:hypothetical protein
MPEFHAQSRAVGSIIVEKRKAVVRVNIVTLREQTFTISPDQIFDGAN